MAIEDNDEKELLKFQIKKKLILFAFLLLAGLLGILVATC